MDLKSYQGRYLAYPQDETFRIIFRNDLAYLFGDCILMNTDPPPFVYGVHEDPETGQMVEDLDIPIDITPYWQEYLNWTEDEENFGEL